MSSNSHDWSALASHNERVVTPSALQTGLNPRPAGAGRPARSAGQLKGRIRLRKRAVRSGAAARG
jgi:hypothetical protein